MKTRYQARIECFKRDISLQSLLRYKLKKRLLKNLPLRLLSRRGIIFMPYDVGLCLTNKCNLKCKMCNLIASQTETTRSDYTVKKSRILSLDENKGIIDKIAEFKPLIRLIGIGEPMIYPHIIPLIQYLNEKKLPVVIFTNGTNLEKLAEEIVNLKVYSINVSIDGLEKVHDKIRGVKGSYANALKGLRKVAEVKKQNNSLFPQLRVNCTISDLNFDSIDKFVDEIVKEDIDMLNFFHLSFKTRRAIQTHNMAVPEKFKITACNISVNHSRIDSKTLQRKIGYIQDTYPNLNITFQPDIYGKDLADYYLRPDKFIHKTKCTIPWTKLYILPDGSVIPMHACVNYNLGNINKKGVKEIWKGKEFTEFRNVLTERTKFNICPRCCGLFAE